MATGDKIYIADKETLDNVKEVVDLIKPEADKIDGVKTSIGETNDSGGTSEYGTSMAKLNKIIVELDNIITNMAKKTDIENFEIKNCVTAKEGTTNVLDTLITSANKVQFVYQDTITRYYSCPYTGIIKVEATLSITNNRNNSASATLYVSCVDGNNIITDQKEVATVSDSNGATTKTESILLFVKSGSKLKFSGNSPRYETAYIQSLKIYGEKTTPSIEFIEQVNEYGY